MKQRIAFLYTAPSDHTHTYTHVHTHTHTVVICLFPMFGGIRFCSAVPNASKTHHYLTYIGLGVCVWLLVCEWEFLFVCVHVLVCVRAKRKTVDYRVQQAKHCLPWETQSERERYRKRERRKLGGSRGRWFRNREVKNGSPGETEWRVREADQWKEAGMEGWLEGGRDRGSDKEVRWQARPAGCKVMKFCGIFL